MRKSLMMLVPAFAAVALAWSADYLADGPDNGRTGWVRDEKVFNTTNVKNMKLLWKIKLDSPAREMHNLFPPIILSGVATPNGTKELAVTAGISDDLFAIDTATGQQVWHRHYDADFDTANAGSSWLCPGGQTAVPVAEKTGDGKYTVYALAWDGRLREIDAADGKDLTAPIKFVPHNGKPYALNLYRNAIYASTGQGCGGVANNFYMLDLATHRTAVFSPAGGGLWGRRGVAISSDGVVYMGTGDGVFDPEAVRLGNAIVAVKLHPDDKSLGLQGFFGAKNANWLYKRDLDVNVSPMAFDYKGKHFVVGTSKECRLWLLDGDRFGGDDHTTPLDRTGLICNDDANYQSAGVWGAMAAWQDSAGSQWVAVPFWGEVSKNFHAPIEASRPAHGGVATFKLEEVAGNWKLVPAWLSRDILFAEEAVVANGVLFTYSNGEDTRQGIPERSWDETDPAFRGGSAGRIADSTHIVAYALDAATGKELWSSGDEVKSFSHFSGMTAVNGKAYIPSFDGTLYCFGVTK
jgi:outer membrane protein assembly factor BamB